MAEKHTISKKAVLRRPIFESAAFGRRAATEPLSAIRAVLFDVDGVIADTARLHTAAWRRLAAEADLRFDKKDADALRGLSREDSLRRLLGKRRIGEQAFRQMMDRKNAYYLEAVEQLSGDDVLPGAVDLLTGLAEMGVGCAAVSVSKNARTVLERLGVAPMLRVIVDGHDAERAKSGLDRFHLAAAAMKTEPRKCAVIEDSSAGISLARQAGMKTVGLGDRSRLAAADLVFESLRGVDARHLLKWLATPAEPETGAGTRVAQHPRR